MKRTDASGPWLFSPLYSDGDRGYRQSSSTFGFNSTGQIGTKGDLSSGFTATDFRPLFIDGYGTYGSINGATYVAYLFAHNNNDGEFGPDSDQDIIKCGSYTGNGSSTGPVIDLGFEPQFVMVKNSSATGGWQVMDSMRGIVTGGNDGRLQWNVTDAEGSVGFVDLTPTGFQVTSTGSNMNTNNATYIYMAIRRGPLAAPTDATKVFAIDTYDTTTGDSTGYDTTFTVDMVIQALNKNTTTGWRVNSRLTGINYLKTNATDAEATNASSHTFDTQTGFRVDSGTDANDIAYMWKRAPSYFDVCTFLGNNTSRSIIHNLTVSPEMIWCKQRDGTREWFVFHKDLTSGNGLRLNSNTTEEGGPWESMTSTTFGINNGSDVNQNNTNYIAYLFATLAGVSKVGSYTGDGTTDGSKFIDCGFTNGPSFVIIKIYDGEDANNWFVFDSVRGIVAGSETRLFLNSTLAESAALDYIDPHSSGFFVGCASNTRNSTNVSGSKYIFYAIA